MRLFLLFSCLLIAAFLPRSVAQTDGWTSTCPATYPSVSEVMIDACGDEFKSEYVVLRTKSASFDVRNFGLSVSNPFNSAFIGSVAITNNSINTAALQTLNTAANTACNYGTVFRNAFSAPYNGIIPPNSTILVFNNKDSTDVTYLSPSALSRLCGSKVFVAFGTLTAQSRGVSIFRNYPQNGSCGTTGCLRKIEFAFNGQTCAQFTYDIKKLPHLSTTNPPVGFNEGSYLLPNADSTLTYGGGNLTGSGVTCMPTARLSCVVPTMPNYGDNFWNVLAYDGQNTFITNDFRGFYTANDHSVTAMPADTIDGSFEFNTAFDGWKPNSAPSEAHVSNGAKTTYDGCNVRSDSFSIQAKRQGFPCGFYKISWKNYDDNARIRLDADGNGVFEYDQTFNAPSCAAGCGGTLWQGDLGVRSRMEIYGSENRGSFNLHLIFQKDTVGHPSVKINILGTTAVACGGAPTGSISTAITGGFSPYTITWRGATAIPAGTLMPTNLPSGIFHATATDALGCVDSAQILVTQTNSISVQAFGDTTFCPNSTAILRGAVLGGNGAVTTNWLTSTSETVQSTSLNYAPKVSKSTTYILRATDASGCFKTDTVEVKTYYVRKIRVTFTPKDTICNDEVAVFTARGSNNYTWSSFPQIGAAALNPQNDKATLFALFLPAPNYIFYAAGQDANGCRDTGSARIWINPLPVVTISPVMDTLCNDGTPYALIGSPSTGGRFYSRTCGNCVENGLFYPNRAGAGAHEVQHEYIDPNGCRNAPSILINVKNCRCQATITSTITRSICWGDSLKIKNVFYKASGIYKDTFVSVNTCDSIVTLNLAIRNRDITRRTITVCPPSVSGIDTAFFRNIYGCDSLIITTKQRASSDTTRRFATTCNIANAKIDTVKLRNISGCDSLIITTTRLINGDTVRRSATTCNIANAKTDTVKLRNISGCDSLIITTTRLVNGDTVRRSSTTCNIANAKIDTVKLRNISGCDSLIITTTRFVNSDTMRLDRTTCDRSLVGATTFFFRNQYNCDSIVVITTRLLRSDTTRLLSTTCNVLDTGTTMRRLQNSVGCDSLIFTTKRFSNADTTQLFSRSCNPSDTGSVVSRFRNQLGCDSIVVLRTTLLVKPDTVRLSATTCLPFNVGTVTFRYQSQSGCDSIVVRTTRLANPDTTRLLSMSCNVRDTGTTMRRLQNIRGCDSIIILKTTLSRHDSTRLTQRLCANDSLRFGTIWLKTAGIFSRTLLNTEGCDSVIILTVQVPKTDTIRLSKTSCNPNLVGTLFQTFKNSSGCDSVVMTQTTLVPNAIRLGLTISLSITCNGGNDGSVKLTSIQNGTPQYQATWSNGAKGVQIDSLKAGIYTVSVTDSLGCQAKDSIRLTEPPPIVTTAKGIAPRCYTEGLGTIQIDAIQGGTAPYTLIFQNNRFLTPTFPRRIDSVRLGFQTLQILDSRSCRGQVSVEVPEAPDRSLELGSDRTILLGDSVILAGFANFTPKNCQWTWTPKDSSMRCSTCFPTRAKPIETTTYTLLLKDSLGCEVSDRVVITVNKPRHIFIPTTFSPNNDLINDYFTVFGDDSVKKVQSFKIFNRWGDAIFDRTDFPLNIETQGWDGSAKGTTMPPDVYIYVAVVEFIDGKVVVYRGDITLIR